MSQSLGSSFVYVTFIRTTPEKLWSALTDAQQMKEYWFGMHIQTEWRTGAAWQMVFPDGRVADTGEILELERPKRIRLKWRNEFRPELKAEGFAVCTLEIEPVGAAVRLTITHTIERGFEVHSSCFRRIAKSSFKPEISARNGPSRPDGNRSFPCTMTHWNMELLLGNLY